MTSILNTDLVLFHGHHRLLTSCYIIINSILRHRSFFLGCMALATARSGRTVHWNSSLGKLVSRRDGIQT